MSSDDGYVVAKMYNDPTRYGVFHYCASVDESDRHFVEPNAISIHDDPTKAIVAAHKYESENWTEYGVHVNGAVLKEV